MSQYSSSTNSSDIPPIEVLKIPKLLSNITNILVELINKNGKGIYDKKNPFCSKFIPTISIADLSVPQVKKDLLNEAEAEIKESTRIKLLRT